MPPLAYPTPSSEPILASARDVFGKTLCKFQLRAVESQLARNDLILVSPTASGKTLVIWSTLGLNRTGIIILVTPLNILGALQSLELENSNITSVAVTSENVNNDMIQGLTRMSILLVLARLLLRAGDTVTPISRCLDPSRTRHG